MSTVKAQRKEARAKKEEAHAQKVIAWIFACLAFLAILGVVWASFM